MSYKVKMTGVIIALGVAVYVLYLFYYRSVMTPVPDEKQWLSVGTVSEVQISSKQLDFIRYEGTLTFQGEAVNEVLDAPKGFAFTKETRVFKKTEDGVREIAAISDLQDGQSIEVWTHFLSDHLLGAAEITIIEKIRGE